MRSNLSDILGIGGFLGCQSSEPGHEGPNPRLEEHLSKDVYTAEAVHGRLYVPKMNNDGVKHKQGCHEAGWRTKARFIEQNCQCL